MTLTRQLSSSVEFYLKLNNFCQVAEAYDNTIVCRFVIIFNYDTKFENKISSSRLNI